MGHQDASFRDSSAPSADAKIEDSASRFVDAVADDARFVTIDSSEPHADGGSPDAPPVDAVVDGVDASSFDAGVALSDASAVDAAPDSGSVALPDAGPVVVTPAEMTAWNTLLADARTEIAAGFTPGASIAIVLHGRLEFTGAVGVRNVVSGLPVTTSTLFRAGSMSKMILAATAMSLVRDGLLDLHMPITHYIPWFTLAPGFDASMLTTDELLTHTSGFPCDTINQCVGALPTGSRDAFFRGALQPLWAPPGAVFDYSNTGYGLASEVLTAAAGVPDSQYEQLAHDRVFVPAGMTTATYDAVAAMAGDYATGYVLNASGAIISTKTPSSFNCPLMHPSGGVLATPTDYAHFAEALLTGGGAVLDPASVANMESAHVSLRNVPNKSYGYGLVHELSPFPTHASIDHDGEVPGYYAWTYLVPDRQFAIVVMVNAVGPRPVASNIVSDALALFIADPESVPSGVTAPATWAAYTGTYNDTTATLGAGVVISLSGGALHVDAPNATDATGHSLPVHGAMTQIATDQWFFPDGTPATFYPDASGTFRYLVTRRGIATR